MQWWCLVLIKLKKLQNRKQANCCDTGHSLTLSALHVTIFLLSHLVKKVPLQELFSAQGLA